MSLEALLRALRHESPRDILESAVRDILRATDAVGAIAIITLHRTLTLTTRPYGRTMLEVEVGTRRPPGAPGMPADVPEGEDDPTLDAWRAAVRRSLQQAAPDPTSSSHMRSPLPPCGDPRSARKAKREDVRGYAHMGRLVTMPIPDPDGATMGYLGLIYPPDAVQPDTPKGRAAGEGEAPGVPEGESETTSHKAPFPSSRGSPVRPSGGRGLDETRRLLEGIGRYLSLQSALAASRTQQERLELLYEIGKSLASTLDLESLLYETIQLAAEVMNAEAGSVMILDPETNELVFQTAHGERRDQLREIRLPPTEGIAGWVFQHGEPTIVNDPRNDPRFAKQVDRQTGFLTRNILCAPLQVKGHTIGVLEVLNKRNGEEFAPFGRDDVALILPLAAQAAIAIENARLYQDLREERDKIIRAQEDVRRELARNLHDGTVQMLSSMVMSLSHARRLLDRAPEMLEDELGHLEELAERAIRETRRLLFELRPIVLETRGLEAALESYVARLNETSDQPTVKLEIATEFPELPPTIARTLFAIVQEAVGNARKHAEASRILVSVQVEAADSLTGEGRSGGESPHSQGATLTVTVKDDGQGFDLDAVETHYDESGSLGLLNMKERAELIDATLTIKATPGDGTSVIVRLPLEETLYSVEEGVEIADEPNG